MKILVAIKQVPDRDARLVIDSSRTGILETDLNWEINESDRYALETGLRLKESRGAGEVVAVTIGPDRARKALGSALAMGADRGIHLNDPEHETGKLHPGSPACCRSPSGVPAATGGTRRT